MKHTISMKTFSLLFGTFVLASAQTIAQTSLTLPAACSCGPVAVYCSGSPTLVVDVTNPSTGKTWMDRNLGASQVATSSTDAASYGDLYQWGRFTDGHQCRTSLNTTTLATTALPAAGNPWDGRFITVSTSPIDWLTPQNSTLWQGASGTNNPCPSGYRLPTEVEFDAERLSWSSNNAAGAFASPLRLTMGGYRFIDGVIYQQSVRGTYWTSSVIPNSSGVIDFNGVFSNMSTGNRAYGISVRCIKD